MSFKPEQQSDKNKDKSSKDVRELAPKQTHPSPPSGPWSQWAD